MKKYELANIVGVHIHASVQVIFFDGESTQKKGFNTFHEAVNHLIREGFYIKSEFNDEASFSFWFQRENNTIENSGTDTHVGT